MPQCIRNWKNRLFHGLRKSWDAEQQLSKAEVHSDYTSAVPVSVSSSQPSKETTQLKDASPPQGLWQSAFDQLNPKEKSILSQIHASVPKDTDQANHPRTAVIINDVIQATKERYEKYQQGGLKIPRSTGEDINLRKQSERIINAALSFKEIISTVANFDPTHHAASAWAVISLGLTMTKNRFDLRDALFDSSEYLTNVLSRCAYVEKNFYDVNFQGKAEIGHAIVRVYKVILQYAAEVLVGQNPSIGRWTLDTVTAITRQRLTELQSSVKEEEHYLHQWVQFDQHLQHEKKGAEILAQVDEMSASLRGLVQNFNLPIAEGAFHNSYNQDMDLLESLCLPATRTELLRQISEWAELSDSKCIFWLNGMAGTGKSTIARTVAQFLEEDGHLGASFFFKKGEADRDNARRFISTITKQLIAHDQQLASSTLRAIEKDPHISAKSLRDQFNKLILQPLQGLKLNRTTMMVIVIDALDECEHENEIRTILELLPQVQYSTTIRLKVFLTSRPTNPILRELQQNHDHQDLILQEIPRPVIEHDIRLFLENRFLTIRNNRQISGDWPGNDTIDDLVTMAVPLFIFAATICRFVAEGPHPKRRLQKLLDFQAATSASQMDKLYLPVLDQLLSRSDEDESKELLKEFQDTVGIIILLASPLSVHSLARFLRISGDDISDLLNNLHSVLCVPEKKDAPVRILHLSFRDYLLNTKSAFHVDEEITHRKIALHCLRIMSLSLKQNICGLLSYGTQRVDIEGQIINQHLSPELQYACRYWVYHLEQSKAYISDEVLSLLKKHFLHWLEAMSLMGIIQEAVGMINTLHSGFGNNTGSEISEFLYDAKRFVLKNIHIIDTAPYQLYCSALIFSPRESIIRKLFDGERSTRIHTLPQVEGSWSAEIQTLEGHSDRVESMAFSPDGRTLASGSDDRTIKLWDATTGKERQTLEGHSDWVRSVAFSPDGRTLASGSDDHTIKLWDVTTGKERQTLEGHSSPVWSVAFSPDGRTLASGLFDHTIKLWDAITGKERQTLEGHSSQVRSVAFSPDGRTLASGLFDHTIKLWDAITGKERQTLEGHSSQVRSVAFSPDGQTVCPQVSLANDWVSLGGEKLLWLPSDYRSFSCSATTQGGILALGCGNGHVVTVGFCTG